MLTDAGKVLAEAGAAVVNAMADARAAIGAYHDAHRAPPVSRQRLPQCRAGSVRPLAALLASARRPEVSVPALRLSDEDVAQEDFPGLVARYDLVLAHRMEHSPRGPGTKWP